MPKPSLGGLTSFLSSEKIQTHESWATPRISESVTHAKTTENLSSPFSN